VAILEYMIDVLRETIDMLSSLNLSAFIFFPYVTSSPCNVRSIASHFDYKMLTYIGNSGTRTIVNQSPVIYSHMYTC
jgi:hypothetical protein